MKQYTFSARVTLDGAQVTVEADGPDEARQKAIAGDWIESDQGPASWADWKIGRLLAEDACE